MDALRSGGGNNVEIGRRFLEQLAQGSQAKGGAAEGGADNQPLRAAGGVQEPADSVQFDLSEGDPLAGGAGAPQPGMGLQAAGHSQDGGQTGPVGSDNLVQAAGGVKEPSNNGSDRPDIAEHARAIIEALGGNGGGAAAGGVPTDQAIPGGPEKLAAA